MSGQFSPRVRELATSLVGAAATAAGAALVPWLGDLLPGLEQCLSATHTPDTQVLEEYRRSWLLSFIISSTFKYICVSN